MLRLGFLALCSALLWRSANCQCYMSNGTLIKNAEYTPCSNVGSLGRICCALNRSNAAGGDWSDGLTQDTCLSNGLCQNNHTADGVAETLYFREQCTEKNWQSGKCLDICQDYNDNTSGSARMTPCDGTAESETWCCGDTTACCGGSDARTIAQTFGAIATSSSTSVATATTSSQASTTTTDSSTNETTKKSATGNGGLSTGAKAGIGIGAALGVVALIGFGYYLAKSLQWKKQAKRHESTEQNGAHESMESGLMEKPLVYASYGPSPEPQEAPTHSEPHELHTEPVELASNSMR